MKAELIPEESFTLQICGLRLEGMRVASRWNGLVELRNAKDEVLIVSSPDLGMRSAFDTLFGDIFRTSSETQAVGAVIVMGSPDLIAQIRLSTGAA